ncbi:MAG: epimerase [Bacteroidetes bacterium]|nr:epimerase [Bacteroidota bacterium]
MTNKLRVIITGGTGMIGEGVLYECLHDESVESVLAVNRRPTGYSHPKLKEIMLDDFFNLAPIEQQLKGYNACFFCLGVTSLGKKVEEYTRLTYSLTMSFAETLAKLNPGMTFCFISGAGTDSTAQGKSMWARVKGRTENDLQKIPALKVFSFRPVAILPTLSLKPGQTYYYTYRYAGWRMPILKFFFPNAVIRLPDLGKAMIVVAREGFPSSILEARDINALGK